MVFLNQSLQLLYSTTAKVDHDYEPKYNTATSGRIVEL